MCQTIQKAITKIRQRDIWVIAGGREHGKGLDVNVGNIFLAGEGVSPNSMSESVDDEVRVAAGFIGLAHHFCADINGMRHQFFDEFEEVITRIVEAAAEFFGVASKREEGDAVLFNQRFETRWRGKDDVMSARHQAER